MKNVAWATLVAASVFAWGCVVHLQSDDYLLAKCMQGSRDFKAAHLCRFEFGALKPEPKKENMDFVMVDATEDGGGIRLAIMDTDERKLGTLRIYGDDIEKLKEALVWQAEEVSVWSLLTEAEKIRLAALERAANVRLKANSPVDCEAWVRDGDGEHIGLCKEMHGVE